jgi:hypothetical protein
MAKQSMIFRTDTLTAIKFPQSFDAPLYVGPPRNLVWQIYNPATQAYSFYAARLYKRFSKVVQTTGTVVSPTGYSWIVEECRVRIINPATASATGKFTANASDMTGATAIALDAAAGTIHTSIPTAVNTGTTGQAIGFTVTGDTNLTFKGEVEVVYRPTGQFTATV